MSKGISAELTALGDIVKAAGLPEDVQHTVLWCLEQLPALCQEFRDTYENRFGERIVSLEKGAVTKLRMHAPELAQQMLDRLQPLHEGLGLPPLEVKPARVPRTRSKKKVA